VIKKQVTDKALIVGCKNLEPAMQHLLFDRFARQMMAVCRRYARDIMEAEDLMQEGFIKIFSRIGQIEDGSLEGWIRKIFVNTCLNHIRDTQKFYLGMDTEVSEPIFQEEDGLQRLQSEEILQLIENLPEGARLIFNLFAIEGFPHTEIAEMLNITEGASRSQLARARKILQEQLKQLN